MERETQWLPLTASLSLVSSEPSDSFLLDCFLLCGCPSGQSLILNSLVGPDIPGKRMSGHYCQHSLIQQNLITMMSHHRDTLKM